MSAQTARGEKARTDILAAASEVILEQGVEGTSLREVARRAGYVPSALYNHFRSRDELVVAVAIESVGVLAGYLAAVPASNAPSRLRGLGHAYVRFAEDHPQHYRLIFDCLTNPPRDWDSYATVAMPFTLIVEACHQGLEEGDLADPAGVGASGLAFGMWSLVDGHVHLRQKHLAHVSGPYDSMFDSALDALLTGMTPKEDSR